MKQSDAGIVPFVSDGMTPAIHPLKVYEYCAAGLPVVATPMEETAAMGAPLRLAATAREFARALEEALLESRGGGARGALAERRGGAPRTPLGPGSRILPTARPAPRPRP